MGELTLTVAAGDRDRISCPLTVELAAPDIAALTAAGRAIPYQTRPLAAGRCELRFIVDRLAAGQTLQLTAKVGPASAAGGGIALEAGDEAVVVKQDGAELTRYWHAKADSARPFWFPVPDPHGNSLTRAYPLAKIEGEKQDHPHHRSLWVAYGDVNGSDNWAEGGKHGTQRHDGWNHLAGGPVCGILDQNLTWLTNDQQPVLVERRVWTIYNLPADRRLLDLELTLSPAPGVPEVKFGDTKEGGLCSVRVATSMDVPKGKIMNSEGGVNEKECWGKRARWCDYSGPVQGNWVGLAILDHPTSFRYPTWWHVRNYGLMGANCFGLSFFTNKQENGDHVLRAGESLHFKYRLYLHNGDAKEADVEAQWQNFGQPPTVTVE